MSDKQKASRKDPGDDPPDHLEERARRIEKKIMVSRQRQRSASAMGALSCMPSVMETNDMVAEESYSEFHQFLQRDALMHKKVPPKPRKQNVLNNGNKKKPQRAMSAIHATAGGHHKTSLWRSYNDLHRVNEEDAFVPPRSRQLSPHPADIIKGQADSDAAELYENNDSMQDGSSDELPNFDNTLGPSDAMQLQKLIDQMHHEFQRLRTAKIQAEAKAEKLQSDLIIQQQANESLSKENERLKVAVNESQTILGKLGGKAKQIDSEHKILKKEYAKLKQKKEVGEAQLVAAELRASAAEKEIINMRNKVKQLARCIPPPMDLGQQEGREHETSLLI